MCLVRVEPVTVPAAGASDPAPGLMDPQRLQDLMKEFSDVFESPTGVPAALGVGHVIRLVEGASTPYQRPYRMSQAEEQ